MRKMMFAAALLLLPATFATSAHAEYEKGLSPRQTAIKNVLLDNYEIMDRDAQAKVKSLIADAEKAASEGKTQDADRLIGSAMMLVAERMFVMNAHKSE